MLGMKTTQLVLFISFLIVGVSSVLLLGGVYIRIVYKHRNVDTLFNFEEYASKRELLIIRVGAIGLVAAIILFVLL